MKQIIELDNGTFKVLNSKRTDYYLVNRAGHCSCKGHGYRRKCRHVDLLKKKELLTDKIIIKGYAGTKLVPKYIHDKNGFRVELIPM